MYGIISYSDKQVQHAILIGSLTVTFKDGRCSSNQIDQQLGRKLFFESSC